jgi:predicted dehydrogenase
MIIQDKEGTHMPTVGVGIIGASPEGWAAISHIPALKALPEYDLRAISTTRRASADRAAKQFGVPVAFDNHQELIDHPDVDLVVISVRVAEHLKLVSAALDAGKMVYCEWPLGNGLAEASELAARAEAAGVRTVIGLQDRYSPAVRRARDLIDTGYLGRILGTTLVGSGMVWGPEVADHSHAYWFDNEQGATALTSPTMFALDALEFVLGDLTSLSANLVVGRRQATVIASGDQIPVTAPDQVAVIGTLAGGAAVSLFYRGGTSRVDNFRWEINGTEGDLVLSSSWGNMQVAELKLEGGAGRDSGIETIPVTEDPDDGAATLQGPPANVARLYRRLAGDLTEGTYTVPDFAHALSRHRVIDAIEQAARTGVTQTLAPTA